MRREADYLSPWGEGEGDATTTSERVTTFCQLADDRLLLCPDCKRRMSIRGPCVHSSTPPPPPPPPPPARPRDPAHSRTGALGARRRAVQKPLRSMSVSHLYLSPLSSSNALCSLGKSFSRHHSPLGVLTHSSLL